ncbi:MAG: U32 family peptidase [Bacteroidales bacterium]|nr:U32 family peptidase [Bacteroidales bacterium]
MAPVGSFESLSAAIQAGADSVYFGLEHLSMRSKSSLNFTVDDLKTITTECRDNGLKTYLTLNTVMFDQDIPLMKKLVDAAKENQVSALIASDQSVIDYGRSQGMVIHLSTQINISNYSALKFYAPYADVVVLARELNLDQVAEIARQIGADQLKGPSGELIKLEMFAHGALCMATSGKCYMSLHRYNSSANRGACLQGCRRSYIVTEQETGDELLIDNEYIMSPKDLSTIGFVDKLLAASVGVLKIEGRARPPEYVKTTVSCYKEAVQSVFDGTYSQEKIEAWTERLKTVFNRGFWDGYYLGKKLGEWSKVYGSEATRRKVYLGKGMNYFDRLGVAEFLMETKELEVGDEILITGPTTGVIQLIIDDMRVDDQLVKTVEKGTRFSIKTDQKIRRSDKLYKWVEAKRI